MTNNQQNQQNIDFQLFIRKNKYNSNGNQWEFKSTYLTKLETFEDPIDKKEKDTKSTHHLNTIVAAATVIKKKKK